MTGHWPLTRGDFARRVRHRAAAAAQLALKEDSGLTANEAWMDFLADDVEAAECYRAMRMGGKTAAVARFFRVFKATLEKAGGE